MNFFEKKFLLAIIGSVVMTEVYWRIIERILDRLPNGNQ